MSIKIKVLKNGPYLVTGDFSFSQLNIIMDDKGNSVSLEREAKETPQNMAFCRCGHSTNAPFCDGTHQKIEFNGSETAFSGPYLEAASEIDGPKLILTDREDLCAYARFCDTNGSIWDIIAESQDKRQLEIAKKQAKNCPSGRLIVWDKISKTSLEELENPEIGYIEDKFLNCSGPLKVTSEVEIESDERNLIYAKRNKVTLCRCGESSNKPFCDGTHASFKFKAKYPH